MSEPITRTEWGVMELAPRPHANTLPQNRAKVGDVTPCSTREEAEGVAETRREFHRPPVAVVSRTVTVTVTAWQQEDVR